MSVNGFVVYLVWNKCTVFWYRFFSL